MGAWQGAGPVRRLERGETLRIPVAGTLRPDGRAADGGRLSDASSVPRARPPGGTSETGNDPMSST